MKPRGQTQGLGAGAWRQAGAITGAALLLYLVVRELPTGTNLSHMDFRVAGGNSIEFCDPANPQFLPVVAARSPVSLTLSTAAPARAGADLRATLALATASGRPIAPEDLEVVQTRRIHLLIVDPSLDDYQHVHPEPAGRPGEWTFLFHPRFGGIYRIFADFTPVATGRGLYAEAELAVAGAPSPEAAGSQAPSWTAERGGYRFALSPGASPMRAGVPAELTLSIRGAGPVPLETVMGAYAHLVAFDAARSGFAHIHPRDPGGAGRPDPNHPTLGFRLTIPRAGRYVIWSEVNLAGALAFAPFWFDVAP